MSSPCATVNDLEPQAPALLGEAASRAEVFQPCPESPSDTRGSGDARPLSDGLWRACGGVGVSHDLCEHCRMHEALRQINRAHLALTRCNQALTRARDEPTLLNEVCR